MAHANNVGFAPYGAYELKATYQRSLLLGNLSVVMMAALALAASWIVGALTRTEIVVPPSQPRDSIIVVLPQPPKLIRNRPSDLPPKPPAKAHGVIPLPVSDDESDSLDNATILTRDELAELNTSPLDTYGGGPMSFDIDTGLTDPIPDPDEFQIYEVDPEFVVKGEPAYPALARAAGLMGTVWIKVLVGKNGDVERSMVLTSCGVQLLDDAAVASGYKSKFKPGIQNGHAVRCWISYRVEFRLH